MTVVALILVIHLIHLDLPVTLLNQIGVCAVNSIGSDSLIKVSTIELITPFLRSGLTYSMASI